MLCLCLNLTYANVVRFPRELDRHGVAFLLPYLLLFLLVGIPIILLEIALGQFLGQGSAHSWRASPIFRGKLINTEKKAENIALAVSFVESHTHMKFTFSSGSFSLQICRC